MSVTATPALTQAPLLGQVQVTTANANRDGSTGTYSTAIAAGANGSLVDYIEFQATGTTAAGVLRIFSTDGVAYRLIGELATPAITPSGTDIAANVIWFPPGGVPLQLPSGYSLRFSTANTETWNVFVQGGNL